MKTGIQVSSFRPVLKDETQVRSMCENLRGMGCRTVQLQWIDRAVPIGSIAAALKESGITSVSVQEIYETMREDAQYYIELNRQTGGTWMCVSRIPERYRSRTGIRAYAKELEEFEKELKAAGQRLCFHPVSADFTVADGIVPVEELFAVMPGLAICADLYHLNRSGIDMSSWLRRYAGRICMVHFKEGKKTESGEILVPAGQGDTDWTGVIPTILEIGVPYAFVEQERWQKDPFVSLQEAYDWLNGEISMSGEAEAFES